jgi:16S rRNA C967 or C1407 C5-methylase (RsmB/RsmF family)/NOL1/NOP2/fmu family ribosome biogenesis protein
MQAIFNDPAELNAFLASLKEKRHHGLRINTLKIGIKDFMGITGLTHNLQPIPWCSEGFYYDNQAQATAPLGKNPFYHAGLYYIQEPGAMSAATVLGVKPGDKVLDLCASPGGKSTQMASALNQDGLLVANDTNFGRMPQLLRNIEMAGIKNAIVLCETPQRLAARFEGYFDRVLADAPCSGEGMFRKDPSAISAWDEGKSARLAVIQKNILAEAAKMVAFGGYLAYSTCTFSPVENEHIAKDFLQNHKDFEAADEPIRIWPHKHKGEGHFVALFRRLPKTPHGEIAAQTRNDTFGRNSGNNSNNSNFKNFKDFCKRHQVNLPKGPILAHGDKLYIPPPVYPDLTGLRVIRAGLALGTLKKNRFEPSYALAMALTKNDFAPTINLPPCHPQIQQFLSGQTFHIDSEDGYSLFCVSGFPIGFAKTLNGRLKNRII